MRSLIASASLTAILATAPAFAAPEGTEEILRALRSVPPPELPARAAEVVNSAPRENRSAVATIVLDAVVQTRPASAGAVRSALISSGALPAPKRVSEASPVTAIAPRRVDETPKPPNTPNENSRFLIAPPHGGNPPGQNGQPDRKGPPPFVDYSKPRGF